MCEVWYRLLLHCDLYGGNKTDEQTHKQTSSSLLENEKKNKKYA